MELTIVPDEIAGALTPYPGDQEYEALRKNPDLFAYRQRSAARDEEVLLLPLFAESELPAGAALSRLPTGDYRRALGTLIDIRLPELLEPLGLERRRFGLERVKRSEDLIEVALNHARIPRPDALGGITKHLRTSFRLRTEYVRGRGSLLPMAIEFGVASVVERPLADIVASSIPIEGLRATRDGEIGLHRARRSRVCSGRDRGGHRRVATVGDDADSLLRGYASPACGWAPESVRRVPTF